jgi:tetratricopeptide (TPR) repeat protein
MSRCMTFAASISLVLLLAGCTEEGRWSVRPLKTGFAEGEQPASFRVNEARAHFALGNVALAAEGFRRALREDPASVDALNGLAACYDRMGRFDLSRTYYEKALALAPGDARLYVNLALSLDLQDKVDEAAALRREASSRFAAIHAPVPLAAPAAPLQTGGTAEPQPMVSIPLAQVDVPDPLNSIDKPRLERVGLAEVVLRTSTAPSWRPLRAPEPAMVALRPPSPAMQSPAIVVLNGTGRAGFAAQARTQLKTKGWTQVAIGTSAEPLRTSQVLFSPARAAEARRLARLLGVPARQRGWSGDRLVIHLGRDRLAPRKAA